MPASDEPPIGSQLKDGERGLVLLQIDGLAYDILQRAMDEGYAPNLKRLSERGDYRLDRYFSGLPAETLPVLYELFYGERIPANDWYSKERGERVDSIPYEAEVRERAAARGEPGLLAGGAAYLTPATGGAGRCGIAVSELREGQADEGTIRTLAKEAWQDLGLLWRSGQGIGATLYGLARDFVSSRRHLKGHGQWNTWWDQHYPYLIAFADNVFPAVATQGVKEALDDRLPAMYVDHTAYDERAHFYGLGSREALESLRIVDSKIGEVLDKVEREGLPYDVVMLSDHGNSPGVRFGELYGSPFPDAVGAMARECPRGEGSPDDLVVAHAYSMANVYDAAASGELSLGSFERRHPGLADSLLAHPGVGLVVGRTEGGVVIRGKGGSLTVTDAGVSAEGSDPLAAYGDPSFLAGTIRDYLSIPETGDLVVFGAFDGERAVDLNDVYSMVSHHGGLGGPQTRPFLLAPARLGLAVDERTGPRELGERLRAIRVGSGA